MIGDTLLAGTAPKFLGGVRGSPKGAGAAADAGVTEGNLYVNGSRSANNLTPRMTDIDGLSAYDTLQAGVKAGSKGACIEASCLAAGGLKAIRTGGEGHVSIRPTSDAGLATWLASRASQTFEDSPFTKYLQKMAIEVWNRE
jgi:hypothetical protein